MLDYMNKADVAHRIHFAIHSMSADDARGIDGMKATLVLAGLLWHSWLHSEVHLTSPVST